VKQSEAALMRMMPCDGDFYSKDLRNERRFVSIRWLGLVEASSRVIWIGSYACGTLGNVSWPGGRSRTKLISTRSGFTDENTVYSLRFCSHIGHLPQLAYSFRHPLRLRSPYLPLHTRHRFLLGSPSDLGHSIPETSLVQRQETPEEG
jgi:hypothetical protein